MLRRSLALTLALPACLAAACGGAAPPAGAPPAPAASSSAPADARPVKITTLAAVGLDATALDRGADPCTDFYRFACGGWLDRTEIPADKPRWVRSFNEIDDRNEKDLRRMLDAAAAEGAGPEQKQLGDAWAACQDEASLDRAGLKPLQARLTQVLKAPSKVRLMQLVAELHAEGSAALFAATAEQDYRDATRYLLQLDQGGLGLPDRDDYLKDDERSKRLRAEYERHVARMLVLTGQPAAAAGKAARDVLRIETALAQASLTRVERRDPERLYNKIDRAGVEALLPAFPWADYLNTLGIPAVTDVNVTSKAFFEGVGAVLGRESVPAWRSYVAFHLVRSAAPHLGKAFVDEAFTLERAVTGQEAQRPRWKRCIDAVDGALGDALARAYVQERFPAHAKAAAEEMVRAIAAAFVAELDGIGWMDPATRSAARKKAEAMAFLIGHPERFRTYDFTVGRDTHTSNMTAARAFEVRRQLAKIGKPVDRQEWFMTAPTVNAYYNPQLNHMVFPAGILQPPFYSAEAGTAVNLGAMGMVVGHELTHGFDDEGSKFDQDGNLRAWWAPDVRARFDQETACVERQYAGFEPLPGARVDGKLTLGENIADLGGVKLAFRAFQRLQARAPERLLAEGFTEEQQFFLSTGQLWCAEYRDDYARMALSVDPHSPPRFRVVGPLANLPEFAQAFACRTGAAMAPADRCSVW